MKKKGNKKMPSPRHKLIHNPIRSALKFCLFVVKEKIFTSNWLHEIHCCLERKFQRNDFSTCSTHFSFFVLGQSPIENTELLSIRRAMEPCIRRAMEH